MHIYFYEDTGGRGGKITTKYFPPPFKNCIQLYLPLTRYMKDLQQVHD